MSGKASRRRKKRAEDSRAGSPFAGATLNWDALTPDAQDELRAFKASWDAGKAEAEEFMRTKGCPYCGEHHDTTCRGGS